MSIYDQYENFYKQIGCPRHVVEKLEQQTYIVNPKPMTVDMAVQLNALADKIKRVKLEDRCKAPPRRPHMFSLWLGNEMENYNFIKHEFIVAALHTYLQVSTIEANRMVHHSRDSEAGARLMTSTRDVCETKMHDLVAYLKGQNMHGVRFRVQRVLPKQEN